MNAMLSNRNVAGAKCRQDAGRPMFPDHGDFPESVVEILAGQSSQRWPYLIPGSNSRALPDAPARTNQTQIPFVILIAFQGGIEPADPIQSFAPPAAQINGIDRALISRICDFAPPAQNRDWKAAAMARCK